MGHTLGSLFCAPGLWQSDHRASPCAEFNEHTPPKPDVNIIMSWTYWSSYCHYKAACCPTCRGTELKSWESIGCRYVWRNGCCKATFVNENPPAIQAVTHVSSRMCSCAHANSPKCTCVNACLWLPVWIPVFTSPRELDLIQGHSQCSVRRCRVKLVHSATVALCSFKGQRSSSLWQRLVKCWSTAMRTHRTLENKVNATKLNLSWQENSKSPLYISVYFLASDPGPWRVQRI